MSEPTSLREFVHRGAADLGYLRAVLDGTPNLMPRHDGDYGAITPQWRKVITSLLDEIEAYQRGE